MNNLKRCIFTTTVRPPHRNGRIAGVGGALALQENSGQKNPLDPCGIEGIS
jgi:hypothetical protein